MVKKRGKVVTKGENQNFPKERRILKRSDFVRLSQLNRKVSNRHFIAFYNTGATRRTRLGITVTKKVGNAVARNQIKRYVREFFRRQKNLIKSGFDINVVAKTQASGIPSKEVYLSLQNIFCKIRETN